MGVDAEFYLVLDAPWTQEQIARLDSACDAFHRSPTIRSAWLEPMSEKVVQFGDGDDWNPASTDLPAYGIWDLNRMRLIGTCLRYIYIDSPRPLSFDPWEYERIEGTFLILNFLKNLDLGQVFYGPDCVVPFPVTEKHLTILAEAIKNLSPKKSF